MKPYGFPIHGAVDGYSQKVLWMEVTRSNNSPRNVATFFLDYVGERRGCPLITRTDCGTENGILAALQCYLRNDDYPLNGENAHRYGASLSNQRIENWWSHFRRICSNWWIHFFKDMLDADILDLHNEFHMECLWFCFHGVLQVAIDEAKEYWNSHYIRFSCHETVGGVPDILYFLPERSNAVDCLVPLTLAKITEAKALYEPEEQDDGLYQEYFHYVMENNNIQYPTNHRQAYDLFLYLVNIQ